MLIACWAVKGGSGTTVVAASLALLLADHSATGAILADLTGDGAGTLGLPDPDQDGLAGWLQSGSDVPADALNRLEVDAAPGLSLLPRGTGALVPERAQALGAVLDRSCRPVVVDCGNLGPHRACPTATVVARSATRSLLVIRPCAASLRTAGGSLPVQPAGAIVVGGSRTFSRPDVERTVGVPVLAQIQEDPAVRHAQNTGLLSSKLPRVLARGLQGAL